MYSAGDRGLELSNTRVIRPSNSPVVLSKKLGTTDCIISSIDVQALRIINRKSTPEFTRRRTK